MSDKPKRAWFQIHLSTAIVLMFAAAGLLWVNAAPAEDRRNWTTTFRYGFPKFFYHRDYDHRGSGDFEGDRFSVPSFVLDVCVMLAILFAVAFLCEWLIRRLEARAPSNPKSEIESEVGGP
jgi:hypothetical protein